MKALWTALLVFTVTAAAMAAPQRLFIALNANVNFPVGHFAGKDILNNQGGATAGQEGELDIGLDGQTSQIYLGYSIASNHATGASEFDLYYGRENHRIVRADGSGDWNFKRLLIGGRIILLKSKVTPVMGAALTIGGSQLNANIKIEHEGTVPIHESSASSAGARLEAGIRIQLNPRTNMLCLLQYYNYHAAFNFALPEPYKGMQINHSDFVVSYVALRAGVTYQL